MLLSSKPVMLTNQIEPVDYDTRRQIFIDRARTALRKGEDLVFDPEDFAELCRVAERSDLSFMPDGSVAFFGCRFLISSSLTPPAVDPAARSC